MSALVAAFALGVVGVFWLVVSAGVVYLVETYDPLLVGAGASALFGLGCFAVADVLEPEPEPGRWS